MSEEKKQPMPCPICDKKAWKNVDQYRLKPSGMHLCLYCGMIFYPYKWESEEQMLSYYRSRYRKGAPPNSNNLFTGQRKLHYHHAFLDELMTKWRGSKNPEKKKIFEVGAAMGMALDFLKQVSGGAQVLGSEMTTTYRRNAFWEFGIELGEDFVPDKYDLIVSYKVLEHQLNPLAKLREYALNLSPDGLLYIGVPVWFDQMCNFGKPGWDIEYYYSIDHINTWTRKLFQTLLKKAGFEIIKEDHQMYDDVYLCKRNDDLIAVEPEYESATEIENLLDKTKMASDLFVDGKFSEAAAVWPNFPDAHINAYEKDRAKWHERGWDSLLSFLNHSVKVCNNSPTMLAFMADVHLRYEKLESAVKIINDALKVRPGHPSSYIQMFHAQMGLSRKAKSADERIFYLNEAKKAAKALRETSAQHFKEATDFIYIANSNVPIPNEEKPLAGLASVNQGAKVVPIDSVRSQEASP